MGDVARSDHLNEQQRRAVDHRGGPLLVIAGAGSGKTTTLAHRVASLVLDGADPRRIMLLTFTRRAACEMTRRAQQLVTAQRKRANTADSLHWSGTFHSIANRLLRIFADSLGVDPAFTVLDRGDSADLLDLLRNRLGFAKKARRFPRKSTCQAIYSRVVNTQRSLDECLESAFPWCSEWTAELKELFGAYVDAKQERHVLDYDDLLLYWFHLMSETSLAARVRERFDHVLVDEYQDTNALQAEIVLKLCPDGGGLTVVGDDAQSIYSFRAATVKNILGFPEQFTPPASVVPLEQNYRSTDTILRASNAVIGLSRHRYAKELFSKRASEENPILVTAEDEHAQVEYVVEKVLSYREEGLELKRQAVLFRTSHHSDALEVELGRRNIPFVKFGGLKFLEAAHVKDLISVLRWVENPFDSVAAFRVLQLLPGIGPAAAERLSSAVQAGEGGFEALATASVPAAARAEWPGLCETMVRLREQSTDWRAQIGIVRRWYTPHLERLYEAAAVREGDLEQLELIAGEFPTRERFLTELTLDPPAASGDEAGPPHLDEDYLILSTIHSAKGQEWDVVFVINAADGCIPSDMATGDPEQIEEERRLLYVAMTRAKDSLHIVHPQRYFVRQQNRYGDRHVYTPVTRFLPEEIRDVFTQTAFGRARQLDAAACDPMSKVDVGARLRQMWN